MNAEQRILRALGGKEDYPHQAAHLAWLANDEKFERDMVAIREMERAADRHRERRIR